ncbi:hypothetical protein [Microvirga sp. BSC39]|uniref:hypothetical protein n=1 Tax=Microvirga sp. BSC39 TaxID=1549810 RepID=UPI0004E8F5A9|nr:hypothetical protein [Microvirga sp. BSC39]KFG68853.1 hypothetical protein JH26_14040 [Microvirga sp. BSC39]
MSDMDREGPTHVSRPAASENLSLVQLEATFEAVLADALVSATRLNQLEQIWSQKKPPLPGVLLTTRADAIFDLCHENEVGFYYTVRDIPALYEIAKASPHLWPRVQAIVTALHRHHHELSLAADEIGLTAAYQENVEHQQAAAEAADAILRQPASSVAVLIAKARVLVASRGFDLSQDPWSLGSLDERALLVLVQDLLNTSPPPKADV